MQHTYHGFFFFFNDTATTEIYTLSLHDALPISDLGRQRRQQRHRARVADRVRGRRLLLDCSQRVIGDGQAIAAPLAGDHHADAGRPLRLRERLQRIPFVAAMADDDRSGAMVGLRPVVLELERMEGADAMAELAGVTE